MPKVCASRSPGPRGRCDGSLILLKPELNKTELRRENGLEVVGEAFTRCIDVLSNKTTEAALPTQVCMFLVRLLAAAAAFDRCRERIIAQPRMVANVARCLYIQVPSTPPLGHFAMCAGRLTLRGPACLAAVGATQGAPRLTHAAVTAVTSFAIDATLQNMVRSSLCTSQSSVACDVTSH